MKHKPSRSRKLKSVSNPVMKLLLRTSLADSMVTEVIDAPSSSQAFEAFIDEIDRGGERGKRFSEYAKRSGYFAIESTGSHQYTVALTSKGRQAAQNVLFEDYALPRKLKWDGHWHIVMFDIGEEHKYLRDMLRIKLTGLGMQMIQNSVYVYPYAFDEFLANLHMVYPEAMQYVMSVEATRLDGQDKLVTIFKKDDVLPQ